MKFFENKKFSNYWFETGTPSFLLKLIKEQEFDLSRIEVDEVIEMSFSSYEIDRLQVTALLIQTGYLTIKDFFVEEGFRMFRLGFPNREVESAFNTYVADYLCNIDKDHVGSYMLKTIRALRNHNVDAVFENLRVFFANIPYDITLKHEKYYQTIFYVFFKLLGVSVYSEVRTNNGRIDAVVEVADRIFIFEFKLHGTTEKAMSQIKDMKYYQKYQNGDKPISLIGAAFDQHTRNIESWLTEEL